MQPDKTAQLRALLDRRILILDGAMGTMIQGHRLGEAEYRGERFADWPARPAGQQRPARPHAAAAHPRDPPAVPRRRRRHHRDQHLQLDLDLAGRLRHGGARVRAQPRGGEARARGGGRVHARRRRTGRASSPACSDRRTRRRRSRPTSTTRASATSRFDELVAAYGEALRGLVDGGVDLVLVRDDLRHAERARRRSSRSRAYSKRRDSGCR